MLDETEMLRGLMLNETGVVVCKGVVGIGFAFMNIEAAVDLVNSDFYMKKIIPKSSFIGVNSLFISPESDNFRLNVGTTVSGLTS